VNNFTALASLLLALLLSAPQAYTMNWFSGICVSAIKIMAENPGLAKPVGNVGLATLGGSGSTKKTGAQMLDEIASHSNDDKGGDDDSDQKGSTYEPEKNDNDSFCRSSSNGESNNDDGDDNDDKKWFFENVFFSPEHKDAKSFTAAMVKKPPVDQFGFENNSAVHRLQLAANEGAERTYQYVKKHKNKFVGGAVAVAGTRLAFKLNREYQINKAEKKEENRLLGEIAKGFNEARAEFERPSSESITATTVLGRMDMRELKYLAKSEERKKSECTFHRDRFKRILEAENIKASDIQSDSDSEDEGTISYSDAYQIYLKDRAAEKNNVSN